MTRLLLLLLALWSVGCVNAQYEYIDRQGEIAFFSYTSVEDIQATNNIALSFFYPTTQKIGVKILMNAFKFEKSLMYEHFNESYIESDLYPKAIFEGDIIDFDEEQNGEQTRIIKGNFTLRGITKPLEIKAKITKENGDYVISGSFEVIVDDYKIKIPAILAPNIAENIKVTFNFQYVPNDDQK